MINSCAVIYLQSFRFYCAISCALFLSLKVNISHESCIAWHILIKTFSKWHQHTHAPYVYQSVWPSARGRKRNERANEWRKPDRMWNDMQGNKLFIFDQRSLLVSVDVRTECDVEMFILKQTPIPLSAHSDFNWFLCWVFFLFSHFFSSVDWIEILHSRLLIVVSTATNGFCLLLLLLSLFLLLLLLLGCYHNTNKLNLLIAI